MDASDLRRLIADLPDTPAGPADERMQALLAANRPDLRYLVARLSGPSAAPVAAVCSAILQAAGAPTGTLGREAALPSGLLDDDPLYVRAGLLVLSAVHQLGLDRPALGEAARREVEVAQALTAFAEASLRVVLLVEAVPGTDHALDAVSADLAVHCGLAGPAVEAAFARVPDGRPVVAWPADEGARARTEALASARGLPLLLAVRDFASEGDDVVVAGERYAALPRAVDVRPWELATGVAAALAVGALGVRMREDWIVAGARAAARGTMGT